MHRTILMQNERRGLNRASVAIGVALALFTEYLNTHIDELMVLIPCLVVATAAMGFAQPRRPCGFGRW